MEPLHVWNACMYKILWHFNLDNIWNGFKIVWENLDKNFQHTYQRTDFTTVSHHYFHMYAVKDRVDLSELSDTRKEGIIDVPHLFPSSNDHSKMRGEFSILLSRYFVSTIFVLYTIIFEEFMSSILLIQD